MRRDLASCDLVHLAAHGRLDPVAPSDSSIVLAGRDELTVSDLVGLRIDAELAVLSACDSGRGAASLGGDVVGLARGLIAAGVRRSVVSLWPVDDAPACVTMSLFHERLVDGRSVAEALQSAQNDLRAMSGSEIAARYVDLGGDADAGASTRRRGAPSADEPSELPDDPEFVDNLDDSDPVESLSGELARVWAPFVVIRLLSALRPGAASLISIAAIHVALQAVGAGERGRPAGSLRSRRSASLRLPGSAQTDFPGAPSKEAGQWPPRNMGLLPFRDAEPSEPHAGSGPGRAGVALTRPTE
ncbi:MAG: CHAT domain-containing protein [Gaiellaceae bacterium]